MIKKLFLLIVTLVVLHGVAFSQTPDSITQRLVPIDSLLSKIKPDTTKAIPDSLKVDTVYIDNPMNVLKVGTDFTSAYGFVGVTYERVIHFMGSVQLKMELLGKFNPFAELGYIKEAYDNTNKINGIGLIPEVRYYGSEKYAPKGLFVGFYLPLKFATIEAPLTITKNAQTYSLSSTNVSYMLLGIGIDGGYQIVSKKGFSIEGVLGLGIAKGTFSQDGYKRKFVHEGIEFEDKVFLRDGTIGNAFYPRAEINIGWAF